MPSPPSVRYAHLEDVSLILRFIRAAAAEQAPGTNIAATEDSLAKTLHFGPPAHSTAETTTRFAWALIIFSPDEQPVGLLIYFHNYSTWMAAPGVCLEELYVVPEYRRQGYARILIETMASAADAAGCVKMDWVYMDLPDLYDLSDIEEALNLPPECEASIPENTTSAPTHSIPALDALALTPTTLQPDAWTSGPDALPRQRQRRYAPRSRRGCLTCRARRKRCDNQHPTCRTCTRVNAECRWPDKLQIPDYSSGATSLKNKVQANTIRLGLESWNAQTNDIDVSPVTDAYPTASATTDGSIPKSLATEIVSPRRLNHAEASLERHLLTYYIHTFIPQVTLVQSSSNFFTSLYIPMAFHHTGVMDAIIAYAAAHLAKSAHELEKIQELNSVVIQRQQQARKFISDHTQQPGLSEWVECKLEVVVALLLLIGLESQTGGRSLRWMQRVNCVRQLLQTYPAATTKRWSAWEAECIHSHFLYHDVMSLIMEDALDQETRANLSNKSGPFTDCPTTLTASRKEDVPIQSTLATHVPPLEFLQYGNLPHSVDCLLGLSNNLFNIITQLRGLPSRDSELIDMDTPEFLNLETELSNWQYDHDMASTLDLNIRLDLIALAECHRLVTLILLYRRCSSRSYCLPHLASQIMCIVSRITPSSAVISALTPILFLAGAELNSEVEMALCAAKLKSIWETSKMMNVASAEEILRVVWEERLRNRVRTDWLEILRARRWTFSLG
ncbi:fungal-specific transcription factor domain-containing protein [Trichoderma chlorosporum]